MTARGGVDDLASIDSITGMQSRRWMALVLVGGLLSVVGCAQKPRAMDYVLSPQPDDVRLVVLDLRYKYDISGYTFKYRQDKGCHFDAAAFVAKDRLVGALRVDAPCFGMGEDFTLIQLRRNWDQPTTAPSVRYDQIRALRSRRPGE